MKPIGKTLDTIKNGEFIEKDTKLEQDFKNVKKIIDDYFKYFIDKSLSEIEIDDIKEGRSMMKIGFVGFAEV